MAKGKNVPKAGTLANVVSEAISIISELSDEIREVVDGASGTARESTQRIQTLDETAGTLEQYVDEPSIPDHLSELQVTYFEFQKKKASRADRRDNAASLLDGVIGTLQEYIDKEELDLTTVSEEDGDGEEVTSKIEDEARGRIEEASTLLDELDNIKGEIEGVEFPGMYG